MFKKIISKTFIYGVLLFTVAISVLPILWVVISSFKTNAQILSQPFALPESIDFEAYKYIFENYTFGKYMLNSIFVAISSTIISILIYSMAGYVFAKFRFPFKKTLFGLFIISLLIPAQAKAQPIFSMLLKLDLINTLTGLSFVYTSLGMAMSLFILRNAFESIPDSLNEAASIEGASFTQKFWRINFPLAKNGIITSGILMFLTNWNEYFFASLFTSSNEVRTLPVALQFFNETFSYNYTRLFAALTLIIIPGVLIYSVAQDKVQKSFSNSGVKG
ncbi:carbohydrate ABC transporter permease [Dolosigranulum pigrum]|uniref:carbohydrate ABC transporter permease n=1 Tax=Dolosigranulum pigrum TaxID=29394 RepID=UPI001C65C649|nr:carbohydrate ABC transporter permease [Dolosigranulum pigrum]